MVVILKRLIGVFLSFFIGFVLSENVQENEDHCTNYSLRDGRRTCYFHLNQRAENWESAWQQCNQRSSTLPVIQNRDEEDKLLDYLKSHQIRSNVWTSGKRNTVNGWKWLNGKLLKRNNFGKNGQVYETHGTLDPSFGYMAHYATSLAYYICQFYGDTCKSTDYLNLTNGCVHKNLSGEDYAGWYTARNRCLEKSGDLAILEDRDIEIMKMNLSNPQPRSYWIGLVQNSWFWHKKGNPEIKFTNWDSYEPYPSPTNACISFNAISGYWTAVDCSRTYNQYTVCQRDDPSSTRTVPERNSTAAMGNGFEEIKAWIIIGVTVAVLIFVVVVFIIVRVIRKKSSATEVPRDARSGGIHDERDGSAPTGSVYASLTLQNEDHTYAGLA